MSDQDGSITENMKFLGLPENARARALLKSMGYSSKDLKRPRIGIANSWGETSPGHIHLRGLADEVKIGIRQAGGTPFEFNSIAQCPMAVGEHGMRYDLPTRDIVAAEVEAMVSIHMFDALVMISACDKNVPAHLLACARLNLPTVFIPGGPMLSGQYRGASVTIGDLDQECYLYAVGRPRVTGQKLLELENAVCPGPGACAILGTANSMQCIVEALGLALPGAGTAPAASARRLELARSTGTLVVELCRNKRKAREFLTAASVRNAIRTLHAIGGSTNAVAHLLALAYELGIENEIDLKLMEQLSAEVPYILDVIPGGVHTMQQFDAAGGVQAVLKRIEHVLETGVPTVAGPALKDSLQSVTVLNDSVIRYPEDPLARDSLVILHGNLADSAVVRTPVIPPNMMQHRGPARVFNSQEEAIASLRKRVVQAGDVVVLRYEGPKGGPGFNEVFKVIGMMNALGVEASCALVTDGRISGFAKGPYVCQVFPEAAEGGPLALVEDGDEIVIDIPSRRLDLAVPEAELERRRAAWVAPKPRGTDGFLTVYARIANPAPLGGGLTLRL